MSTFTLVYTRALPISFYSDDVDIPFPNVVSTGGVTSLIANQLKCSSADFDGIQNGSIVRCETTQLSAYVIGFVDSNTLLLSSDIFSTIGDDFTIYSGTNDGCYIYVPTISYSVSSGLLEVETIGGDIVTFANPPAGILPVQVRKIRTSTDILKLIALW